VRLDFRGSFALSGVRLHFPPQTMGRPLVRPVFLQLKCHLHIFKFLSNCDFRGIGKRLEGLFLARVYTLQHGPIITYKLPLDFVIQDSPIRVVLPQLIRQR